MGEWVTMEAEWLAVTGAELLRMAAAGGEDGREVRELERSCFAKQAEEQEVRYQSGKVQIIESTKRIDLSALPSDRVRKERRLRNK